MDYTFLATDLLTGTVVDELPLIVTQMTLSLCEAGALSAVVPIADPSVASRPWQAATQPRRTAIYVDRGGVLIWGGIIWSRRTVDNGNAIQIDAQTFESYFARRVIKKTLMFSATDQFEIVRQIIGYAQSAGSGNIGVQVDNTNSGVLRDRTYYWYERKPVLEAVQQLAQVDNGFEFTIDVSYDTSGSPVKRLRLGYPRLGAPVSATGYVFELPGNIVTYDWPEDGSSSANSVTAVGAGEGDQMLVAEAMSLAEIDAGYPLLEATTQYKDVSVFSTLTQHAVADMRQKARDIITPALTVRADVEPQLGSYRLGDAVRIVISSPRHPGNPGLDTYARIVGISVHPPQAGQPESVDLTLQMVDNA